MLSELYYKCITINFLIAYISNTIISIKLQLQKYQIMTIQLNSWLHTIIVVFTFVLQVQSFTQHKQIIANNQPVKVCDGNRFKHISTYALGAQNDLALTFHQMQNLIQVDKVVYRDQLFRTYTIFQLNLTLDYMQSFQSAVVVGEDIVKISGGIIRISYAFKWSKRQLTAFIQGSGKGAVKTDSIQFRKKLSINNQTKLLQWNLVSANPITITNSLTISEVTPYKAPDYDVLNQMLNQLKSGQATVKTNLLKSLNTNFSSILAKIVHQNNNTWKEPQKIYYSYSDYHGEFTLTYDNVIINATLLQKGFDLTLSQTIQNDSKFQCGEKVPQESQGDKYGGLQQYISNAFLKSTLRNALNRGFLDVVLTQQFWQSPAFQFFIGDVHQIMPSTKNISSLQPINGKCKAQDDKYFNLSKFSQKSYLVNVNFSCEFKIFNNTKKLFSMNLAVDYEAEVRALSNSVNFIIKSILGKPNITQQQQYPIKKMDLAQYMIEQTLKMATNSKVFGSGFKTLGGKYPGAEVRDKFLFLFDTGTKNINPTLKQIQTDKQIQKQKNVGMQSRRVKRKAALPHDYML